MIAGCVFALVLVAGVLAEVLLPGLPLYHNGWYIFGLIALSVALALRAPGLILRARPERRGGIAWVLSGVALIALTGIAFSLFAPDAQTVIGAPGSTVNVDGLDIVFPISNDVPALRLQQWALITPQPRTIVEVGAQLDGHRATITQPNGSAFLSPFLLMQHTQQIAGFMVPYDSFAVPAAHRIVKAVLLGPEVVSHMPSLAAGGGSVVLFDVEDENEREIPHGIGVARNQETIQLGGVALAPNLIEFPALRVTPVPYPTVLIAVAIGQVLLGFILVFIDMRRRPKLA